MLPVAAICLFSYVHILVNALFFYMKDAGRRQGGRAFLAPTERKCMKRDMKFWQKAVSAATTAVLVAGMVPGLAYAAEYQAPTEAKAQETNTHVTSAVHAAAEMTSQYLGMDNTTYRQSSFNIKSYAQAITNPRLGIFASALNRNPDVMMWNYFYNFYAEENGLTLSEYVPASIAGGGPMGADSTGASIKWRPDVLIGISANSTAGSYAAQIAALPENNDDDPTNDYDPYLVPMSASSYQQILLYMDEAATAADKVVAESNGTKTLRYDSAAEQVSHYEDVVMATQYYILSQIDKGTVSKRSYAYITAIDTETNMITLACEDPSEWTTSNRIEGALMNTCDNIGLTADVTKEEVEERGQKSTVLKISAANLIKADPDCICLPSATGSGTSTPVEQLKTVLTAAGMSEDDYNNLSIFTTCGGFMANNNTASEPNGPEYGLYVPEIVGYIYNDIIDQMDLTAYYFSALYGVADSSLQNAINITLENMTVADNLQVDPNYKSNLETKWAEGKAWYEANKDSLMETNPTLMSLADAKETLLTTITDDNVVLGEAVVSLTKNDSGEYDNVWPTVSLKTDEGLSTLTEATDVNTRYYDEDGNRVFNINEPGTYQVRVMGIAGGSYSQDGGGYTGETYLTLKVLGEGLDLEALNSSITAAQCLDSSDYTAGSFAKVTAAVEAALALADDATQDAVNAAAKAIDDAIAALEAAPTETIAVYRLYNEATSEHLWTTSLYEYNKLAAEQGWTQEGVGWQSLSADDDGAVGVYRLYNEALGVHHYTTDTHEISVMLTNGWTLDNKEKPLFYAYGAKSGSGAAVYRLYNDGLSQHHLTMKASERDKLVANYGWTDEAIAFCVPVTE